MKPTKNKMSLHRLSIFFLVLFFLSIACIRAQVITDASLFHRTDALPSTMTGVDLHAVYMLPSWSSIDARYRVQIMKQDSANFLKASSTQLHELHFAYTCAMFGSAAMLRLEPQAFLRAGDASALFPGYGVTFDAKLLHSDASDISFQASNHPGLLTSGLPSIEQGILYNDLGVRIESKWFNSILLTLNGKRSFLSDQNVLDEVYAWLLCPILHDPEIRIGYAFQYANTRYNRWQQTGSEYDATIWSYRYSFFYLPYYTPIFERGHSILASIQYSPWPWISFALKASIPVYSRAARTWFASQGWYPHVQNDGYRTDENKVVQSVLNGSVQFELSPHSWLAFSVERFNKPYYTYSEPSMKFTQTF